MGGCAVIAGNSVGKRQQSGFRLILLSDTVFRICFGCSMRPFSAC